MIPPTGGSRGDRAQCSYLVERQPTPDPGDQNIAQVRVEQLYLRKRLIALQQLSRIGAQGFWTCTRLFTSATSIVGSTLFFGQVAANTVQPGNGPIGRGFLDCQAAKGLLHNIVTASRARPNPQSQRGSVVLD
jgi:hypothetical protein